MNKNNIITLIRLTFIIVSLAVAGISLYQIFFMDYSESVDGFLSGLTTALLFLPIMFTKKGLYAKRMYALDERELIIQIIANYLTLIVLLFAVIIFFINYLNNSDFSYPLLTIKILIIIGFKFYMTHILRKFL